MKRVALCAIVLVVSCVTTRLTPEGQQVRATTNQEAVKGCKLVGPLESSDKMNSGMHDVAGDERA